MMRPVCQLDLWRQYMARMKTSPYRGSWQKPFERSGYKAAISVRPNVLASRGRIVAPHALYGEDVHSARCGMHPKRP